MSWRTLMKAENTPESKFPGPKETSTKYTKPPGPTSEDPKQENFVDIVDESQEPEDPRHAHSVPFQIGEKVSYRTPVIKTPTDYSWVWHHGIVKEISQGLELVIITPRDTPQKWIGISFIYVRAYEKNEINELMEEREHGQKGG
jgi:hypothetical protein